MQLKNDEDWGLPESATNSSLFTLHFSLFTLHFIGVWLSLVERLVRDQEVGCSNHLAPTTKAARNLAAFLFLWSDTPRIGERGFWHLTKDKYQSVKPYYWQLWRYMILYIWAQFELLCNAHFIWCVPVMAQVFFWNWIRENATFELDWLRLARTLCGSILG